MIVDNQHNTIFSRMSFPVLALKDRAAERIYGPRVRTNDKLKAFVRQTLLGGRGNALQEFLKLTVDKIALVGC